jgi:hypothetical protein
MEKQKESGIKPKRNRNTLEELKYRYPVKVRFNKAQNELLKAKSEKTGIKLAILIRELTLKSNINITSKYDLDTYNQIRKIGVNINQISRKFNTIFAKNELTGEYEKLIKFMNDLKKILNSK